ncbi:MAG: hypothetical protein QXG86_00485 [Candidatus Woesearchaeota archaeon]
MILMFFEKIKNSFKKVKKDVESLRQSTNDWVVFLNRNQADIKIKIYELENRIRKLEAEKEIEIYR